MLDKFALFAPSPVKVCCLLAALTVVSLGRLCVPSVAVTWVCGQQVLRNRHHCIAKRSTTSAVTRRAVEPGEQVHLVSYDMLEGDLRQEGQGHINIRKIPGTPAGGTNRGLPASVPGISVSCYR